MENQNLILSILCIDFIITKTLETNNSSVFDVLKDSKYLNSNDQLEIDLSQSNI